MGNFAEARDYGEQALDAAKEAEDEVWQLNSSVLIAQADGMFHFMIYWLGFDQNIYHCEKKLFMGIFLMSIGLPTFM